VIAPAKTLNRFLTTAEVAHLAGVGADTVRRAVYLTRAGEAKPGTSWYLRRVNRMRAGFEVGDVDSDQPRRGPRGPARLASFGHPPPVARDGGWGAAVSGVGLPTNPGARAEIHPERAANSTPRLTTTRPAPFFSEENREHRD
jgi:hypothetical protein